MPITQRGEGSLGGEEDGQASVMTERTPADRSNIFTMSKSHARTYHIRYEQSIAASPHAPISGHVDVAEGGRERGVGEPPGTRRSALPQGSFRKDIDTKPTLTIHAASDETKDDKDSRCGFIRILCYG
jgi:hypothetical protein